MYLFILVMSYFKKIAIVGVIGLSSYGGIQTYQNISNFYNNEENLNPKTKENIKLAKNHLANFKLNYLTH